MDNKQYKSIVLYLGKHIGETFTMHQLSKLTEIPYATLYRTIKEDSHLFAVENVGKAKTIKLRLNNPIIKSYLIMHSFEEMRFFLKQHPIINKIKSELKTKDIVLLFGSYAKGEKTEKSDIDLLIINKDGKRSISFSKYELLFKKKINPIFITKKEFKLMLKDKEENVGKQALKDHIILNNPEEFWKEVLNAI